MLALLFLPSVPISGEPASASAMDVTAPMAASAGPEGYNDTFDDDSDITLSGDARAVDGRVMVSLPVFFEDGFNRSILAPWNLDNGSAEVSSGLLHLKPTPSGSEVSIGIEIGDLFLLEGRFRVPPGSDWGPTFKLVNGTTVARLTFYGDCIWLNGYSETIATSSGIWYNFTLLVMGRLVEAECEGVEVQGGLAEQRPNFNRLVLSCPSMDECEFDDIRMSRIEALHGAVVSIGISLPKDHRWDVLDVSTAPDSPGVALDVLDATNGAVVPGFEGIQPGRTALEGLDYLRHPAIRLRARMTTEYGDSPCIYSWSVNWTEETGWMDGLDDLSRLSSLDHCSASDGGLGPDPTVFRDDFSRMDLMPWDASHSPSGGSVALEDGAVVFDGGQTDGSWSSIERALDLRDVNIELSLNMSSVGVHGIRLHLWTSSGRWVEYGYNSTMGMYTASAWDGRLQVTRLSDVALLPTDLPLRFRVYYKRGGETLFSSLNSGVGQFRLQNVLPDVGENFTGMRIQWGRGDAGSLDDIWLRSVYLHACAVSEDVSIPAGMAWREAVISPSEHLAIDVVDVRTGEVVPGYADFTLSPIDLRGIDAVHHPVIRLRAWLTEVSGIQAWNPPRLDWWRVRWELDDNYLLEPYDDASNVTLAHGLEVKDGSLRTRNLLLRDYFERFELGPWGRHGGSAEIWDGRLWTRCDGDGALWLSQGLPSYDEFNMTVRVNPRVLGPCGWFGVEVHSWPEGDDPLGWNASDMWLLFNGTNREVVFWEDCKGSFGGCLIGLNSTHYEVILNEWTNLEIQWSGANRTARFGGALLCYDGPEGGLDSCVEVRLWCARDTEVLWDNLLVNQLHIEGTAVTSPIDLPEEDGLLWLEASSSQMSALGLCITAVDGVTLEPIEGLRLTGDGRTNLTRIDISAHPSIRLEVHLRGQKDSFADVNWFRLFWADASGQVFVKRKLERIVLKEDEPARALLDLHDYLSARGIRKELLAYSVANVSDPGKVLPQVEGSLLSIDLPTRNWYGNATFRVVCSFGGSIATTGDVLVVVEPVDDPPVFEQLEEARVVEGVPRLVDLGAYISDVDTPLDRLVLTTDDANCTPSGLHILVQYSQGGFTRTVAVRLSDGTSIAQRSLTLLVEEVNDLPVIETLPLVRAVEDEPLAFDLAPYVTDEETPDAALLLEATSPGVVSVDGLILHLFYNQGGLYEVPLTISDGLASVAAVLRIDVQEVNDPPIILGLGDLVPPVVVTLGEGCALDLQARVFDEDGDPLSFTIESEWRKAWVDEAGMVRIMADLEDVGEHVATLVVEDGRGGRAELRFLVRVLLVNDPPGVPQILSPSNHSSWAQGHPLELRAAVSDPDLPAGQVLWVIWSSNASGILDNSTWNGTPTARFANLPIGTHRLTVTVWDGEFARSAWVEVTIAPPPAPPEEGPGWPRVATGMGLAIIALVVVVSALVTAYEVRRRRLDRM